MIPSVQLEISRQYSNGHTLIFFGIFQDFLPRHLLFQMQDVKDSLVHPVKMSLRIRACIRIALAVFQRAELSFAVIVTEVKISPFPREDPSASSATVLVTVFAVR
ncbi:MAG: hypothetical protein ACLUAR_17805 [Pilosibacter sp.]